MRKSIVAASAGALALMSLGAAGAPAHGPRAQTASYKGTRVSAADVPWAVSLTTRDAHFKPFPKQHGTFSSGCSAVVIGPRLAMTATHCVDTADTSHAAVRVGTDDLTSSPGRVVRVVHVWSPLLHAGFDNARDVALLETKDPLGVPALPIATELPKPGDAVASYGFGTDSPRTIDGFAGQLRRLDSTVDPTCLGGVVKEQGVICTVAANGGGARPGDSGGALVAVRDGVPELVGIASATDTATGRLNLFADAVAQRTFVASPPASALVPKLVSGPRITGDARPGGRVACEVRFTPKPDRVDYNWYVGSPFGPLKTFHLPNGRTIRSREVRRPDGRQRSFTIPSSAAGKSLTCSPGGGSGRDFEIGPPPVVIRKLPRSGR